MADASTRLGVGIEENAGVLTFTLDNLAAGNEVNGPMFDAMLAALNAQARRPTSRVLRLRAEGPVFCSGRERAAQDADAVHAEVSRVIAFMEALRGSPLISLAEVQGNAIGFGMAATILCDFSMVSSAARLAIPEMRKGLPPAAILAFLGRYALPKASFPLVLFGDEFSPEEALAAGLISKVCPPAALSTACDAIVDRVLKLDEAGARHCKAFFQAAQEGSLKGNFGLAAETLAFNTLRRMEDNPSWSPY